jgi:hypothetical protein
MPSPSPTPRPAWAPQRPRRRRGSLLEGLRRRGRRRLHAHRFKHGHGPERARGEGGDFIDGGTRIQAGGDFVLNPHGGQLSAGRLHGYGFFHEAVLQLRGQAGARQVADASTAVVTTGGGHPGGAVLLVRD